MENLLRKRLALIKSRAKAMKEAARGRSAVDTSPLVLADAVPGVEHTIEGEAFYRVRLAGEEISDDTPAVTTRYLEIAQRHTWPLISLVKDPGPAMAKRISNDQVCFLDIETTGLSPNTYVFLCGLMFAENGRLVVEQLFARDYSEETAMLRFLDEVVSRYPMVVTYNGAGFDVPFLETRMAVARIRAINVFEHVDLIDAARGHFTGVLENCRLETIERHLRGRNRTGDIPGRDIPEAYHEFVRSGNARDIQRIIYHNRMDLLAMVYLVNYLADRMA
jgi:uncharacterized protein YprB with RNaseH-like and TPR domain